MVGRVDGQLPDAHLPHGRLGAPRIATRDVRLLRAGAADPEAAARSARPLDPVAPARVADPRGRDGRRQRSARARVRARRDLANERASRELGAPVVPLQRLAITLDR